METVLVENVLVSCKKRNLYQVNLLRYDYLSHNHHATSGHVLSAFDGIDLSHCPPRGTLVHLFLAEIHWTRMLQQPLIRHPYQFPNVPSGLWLSMNVDDDVSLI